MNTQISVRSFLISLISLIVIFFFYSYLAQLEAPLWMVQFTFYAFMTAIFGFVFLGILAPLTRDYFKKAEIKKIREKKALEKLKNEYIRCSWSIENHIKEYVEKNQFTDFEARLHEQNNVGEVKKSEELKRRVQEWNEKRELYKVLCEASKYPIKSFFETTIKKEFPKTLNRPHPLIETLQADFLMNKYLNGEKVTESWFKDSHPIAFKNIFKDIEETERKKLNILFYELNKKFESDIVLQRFRKEKEELKKHTQETIKAFQTEIDSLDEKLKKYSNLIEIQEDRPRM